MKGDGKVPEVGGPSPPSLCQNHAQSPGAAVTCGTRSAKERVGSFFMIRVGGGDRLFTIPWTKRKRGKERRVTGGTEQMWWLV